MPFVIPGSPATGNEGLVLDGLDLAQGEGGAIRLDAFTAPLFKKRVEWVEAADSNGAILARDPLESVGDATVRVAITAVSRDAAQITVGLIVAKLEEAERNPGGIPLVWTPSDSSTSATAYVLTGEVTEFPVDWESGYMSNQPLVTFTLSCAPGWYGTPVTYTKTATAGPLVTMDLPDVPGDVPGLGVLTVTDASSQSRRTVEWGAEQLYYNPSSPTSLVLDSDNLVTSGFAGTQTTFAGAYDPGASGSNVIDSSVYLDAPVAVCGTGAQPHIGAFRVKARLNIGGGSKQVRLAWRVGDGPFTLNDWASPGNWPTGTIAAQWREVDLGLITIPQATTGTQSWTGRLEAYDEVATGTIHVDYLMLIPVEAGYGKAVASYSYSTGLLVARDTFTGTTAGVALNGRTADLGGTWATTGAGADFAFVDGPGPGNESVSRSAISATRLAALGAVNYTDTFVRTGIQFGTTITTGVNAVRGGVIARYVDSNNFLFAAIDTGSTGTDSYFILASVVTGVTTVHAISGVHLIGNYTYTVELTVYANGQATAVLTDSNGIGILSLTTSNALLAPGGALASGKPGLYDFDQGAIAFPRYYDNFQVYAPDPAAEPIVIYPGRSLQIRHDDTIRESSAGGTWGRPQSYHGTRFRVQPAGTADRTTRVAVKASRNDLTSGEDANLTDTISLAATVTPRYSVVPRA